MRATGPDGMGPRSLGSSLNAADAESMTTDTHDQRVVGVSPTATGRDARQAVRPARKDGFVCWLGDVACADASRVGAKAVVLGEMTRAGLPVRPGFVVTADAYLRALDPVGGRGALRARIADVDVDDPTALTRAAKECQAFVRYAEMPTAVRRAVLDAYTRLRRAGDAERVVVRSSPTPEGPGSSSCPGMDETFTDVRSGLELVDRIVDCWASRWSPRVVAYRATHALTREPAMAVVVQALDGDSGPATPEDR